MIYVPGSISNALRGHEVLTRTEPHKSRSLENPLCRTQQGPQAPGLETGLPSPALSFKLIVIGCAGWRLHDNPRASTLEAGADGKIPTTGVLSEDDGAALIATRPRHGAILFVRHESSPQGYHTGPGDRGRVLALSPFITSPGGTDLCRGRAGRQSFPAPAEAGGPVLGEPRLGQGFFPERAMMD